MARKNDYGISTILYAILILFYIPISILIFIFKTIVIVLVTGLMEHMAGDKVLAGEVALNDDLDNVFRRVGIVRRQTLSVF